MLDALFRGWVLKGFCPSYLAVQALILGLPRLYGQ